MIPLDFKDYFVNCTPLLQQEIVSSLLSLTLQVDVLSDTGQTKATSCPHCSSAQIRANGILNNVQRYACKSCKKYFSQTTGKFWYNIKKKDKLSAYLYCLLSGYSIRKCAKQTGISLQTSFDWRHKLLTSFSAVAPEEFSGIVESDDLFFAYSEKGSRNLDRKPRKRGQKATSAGVSDEKVAVIATCDRTGNKDFRVATKGRISKEDLDNALQGKLDKAIVLCSDSHRSYTAFAKSAELTHKKFNASKGQRAVDKVYHVQNVNNMDMRLRKFMDSFNGVATKYLQNYLNWFLVLEKIKNTTSKIAVVTAIAFASNNAWYQYKQEAFNMLIRT